ncbi:MAG: aminotransferase class I/II-fold pyridoxal phosphate-dependent enzyme [Bacteroidota bacterium]
MIINTAKRIGTVKEYFFSRKLKEIAQLRAAGKAIINLGIGSPDLPPADAVIERLQNASADKNNHAYQSYVGIPELRTAFAQWYQTHFDLTLHPDQELLPLMGSKEGIMHISMTFLETGDEVLIPNPGYPAYRATANLAGATTRTYELSEESGWLPDLEGLAQQDLSKVKIMWVNYPHMPTGTPASRQLFEALIAFGHQHQILICNDNPYSFILNDEPLSLLAMDGAKEVALELNSLSKSHNMAGWRIGVLAGQADYLQEIIKFKSNMDSGMFRPLQLAAVEALANPRSWYIDQNVIYRQRQMRAFELLDLLNCRYDRQQCGMFVWARIPKTYENGFEMSDELLQRSGVFITPGGIFGSAGDQYLRISLCSSLKRLDQAMKWIQKTYVTTSAR